MTEVYFYQLQQESLEQALPKLLDRTLARAWKAVVQFTTRERLEALDSVLWTFDEESFLPHATDGEQDLAHEPIVLTTGAANPNAAEVRFLVEGAPFPEDARTYQRIVLLFDGADEVALAAARVTWKALREAAEHELAYWQQSVAGRWEKKG